MTSKLLVVFGATGNQGGSVIDAILRDPKTSSKFKLRGVTRDTSNPAAQRLAGKGVEMVAADFSDKASLSKAMTGAYAVFSVTNYWESMSAEVEVTQGKNVADVAKVGRSGAGTNPEQCWAEIAKPGAMLFLGPRRPAFHLVESTQCQEA
jgi:uncharacterized protein YbjT (DUF2867 family)